MRTLLLIVASGFIVACGGADANPLLEAGSDGAVDGSSGNADGAMDAAADAALDGTSLGDAGPCTKTWTSCATCLTSSCAAQLSTCNANNACKSGLVALAMCKSMCGGNCDGTFENAGGQAAKNVLDCGKNNCNVCGF